MGESKYQQEPEKNAKKPTSLFCLPAIALPGIDDEQHVPDDYGIGAGGFFSRGG